jgi:hypothetical protein
VAPTTSAHWPPAFHFVATSSATCWYNFSPAGLEELQVGAAGVGGAAEDDDAALLPGEIRLDRIETHVGIHRQRVGAVALEGLARVLLGGGADVAALGVEDHRDAGVLLVDVADQRFELVLGAVRREVGDLRLEGAGEVGRGVGDRLAEFEDGVAAALQMGGEFRRVGVEADAEQGIVARPGGGETVGEGHGGCSNGGERHSTSA